MFQLSGSLRRLLGKRVQELGGNAVVGFKQYFDLEQDNQTITARAIGTAVRFSTPELKDNKDKLSRNLLSSIALSEIEEGLEQLESIGLNDLEVEVILSSDVITPLDGVVVMQSRVGEPQIYTMNNFPPNTIIGIGGLVS